MLSSAGTHPHFLQSQDIVCIALKAPCFLQLRRPPTEPATRSSSVSCCTRLEHIVQKMRVFCVVHRTPHVPCSTFYWMLA